MVRDPSGAIRACCPGGMQMQMRWRWSSLLLGSLDLLAIVACMVVAAVY
jgi:hypothetical protein